MKPGSFLAALISIFILSACEQPLVIPANVAVTLPPNQNFIISATAPVTPPTPGPSPTPTLPPTATLTPIPTATFTETPTLTPAPTRKSPFPAAPGTPMLDPGFQPITLENLPALAPIFTALESTRRHAAISADRQKLFLSTSTGLFLFNRKGEVLAHWKKVFTAEIPCESCLSVNRDGSRFAVMTRNAGKWEAQVYDVQGENLTQVFAFPAEPVFQGLRNEASIAISPDNGYLAFKAGAGTLHVINLETKLQVLGYDRQVNGVSFTPDGVNFVIHGGQELLFYETSNWAYPANNLLLPREETPFTFSPSGKRLAVALPTKMRIYAIEKMRIIREIDVLPSNAVTRQWQLDFKDDQTLNGYAIRWDTFQTNATVETGQWEVETGKTLSLETVTTSTPDALVSFWGAALPLPTTKGDLEAGASGVQTFRFISDTMLLVNSPHVVCWFKLFTGETTCSKDADHILFATDGNIYVEVVSAKSTLLQNRSGETVFEVGAYRFKVVNRTGEWAVIESGKGTNLYARGKKLPQESVKGSLQAFAENAKQIVLTTLEKENTFTLTIIDKETGNALYQKKDNFLYQPIVMTSDGTVYYLQRDLDRNQTILNYLDPVTRQINEATRISLPAEPRVMTLSVAGLLALGQEDGSVLVMTQDGGQSFTFQGATSAIEGLAFSPNGLFLAVASGEGVRVFAVLP